MYCFGNGANDPAISRKILESDLIEKHHWLPQDIAKIPYKKLQEHLFIQRQKNVNNETRANIQKAKNNMPKMTGSGKMKKFTREV